MTSAGRVRWEAARALERLGGDEQLFQEIIQIFMEEAPKQITGLREALAHGDAGATERIAHTLKGELSYLGITQASRHAAELEDAGRNAALARAASVQILLEQDVEGLLTAMRVVLGARSPGAN